MSLVFIKVLNNFTDGVSVTVDNGEVLISFITRFAKSLLHLLIRASVLKLTKDKRLLVA